MLKVENLFPTKIARGSVKDAARWNTKLLKEIKALSAQDRMGREWSKKHYLGGYTSYGSLSDLHRRSPLFAAFAELLQPQAEAFAKAQGWNLDGMRLEMTALWMDVMGIGTHHSLHLHPHSVVSGAYYVSTPTKSVSLKLEDPRMGLYMNAPLRELGPERDCGLYHEVRADAGTYVLFESWLRHEVPPNRSVKPRVSLSFNYSLETEDSSP